MSLLSKFDKALQAIYDHVGLVEDWVVYAIDDKTDKFWDTDGDTVFYANTKRELKKKKGNYYEDVVYKQRFYSKWVYEGKKYTLIICDPRTDTQKWFRVFKNSKRVPSNNN